MADVPAGLGTRGLELWEALSGTDRARNALALEAARTADRLDDLDKVIQGDGVLHLLQARVDEINDTDNERIIVLEVKFQNVLSEARQQQLALAALLKTLAAGGAAAASPTAAQGAVVTPLDRMKAKGLKKA